MSQSSPVNDPGKYDDICTGVRLATNASTVIVIILDGSKGDGFSVQSFLPNCQELIPDMLENVAKEMRVEGPYKIDEVT